MVRQTPSAETVEFRGPATDLPLLLTIPQAGLLVNKSRSWVYDKVLRGEFPGVVRLGKSIRIRRGDLERWIADLPADSIP